MRTPLPHAACRGDPVVAFADLRLLDTRVFRTPAAAYGRLAGAVALHADDVDIANRHLVTWAGDAGDGGRRRGTELWNRCDLVAERATELDRALSDHASQMEQLQRTLADIVLEIGASGDGPLRIDLATGAISVNWEDGSGALVTPEQAQARQRSAERYASEIEELLAAAERTDADTAARIDAILTDAVGGARPANADALLAGMPSVGTDPARVSRWWDSLTPQEREFLIRERPDVIGWLDGVPAADRDEANRLVMEATAAGLESRRAELAAAGPLTEAQQRELDEVTAKLDAIDEIRARMASTEPGDERIYLIGFDAGFNAGDDGRAIIAVGDPDTADNVVTYVPGTGADLGSTPADLERANLMVNEANAIDPSGRTSAIMWVGYDAPATVPQATDEGWARTASADLDRFQDGLRATHEGSPAHNTVMGHSYGSTVIGYTASMHGIDADELIFVGSPGVGVDSVSELRGADGQPVPPEHVWSSHALRDPIQYASYTDLNPTSEDGAEPADILVHGRNPSEPEFGAREFTADPGDSLGTAHSQYWDPYSTSLRNMAYIITGNHGQVS